MMEQIKTLKRLKDLREEQAFRRVTVKRREVAEAKAALEAARQAVSRNASAMPGREEAIYKPIIKQIVSFDDVEEAKADLQSLQKQHSRLVDSAARAAHVLKRHEKELQEAIEKHQEATREQDKYITLSEEVTAEWQAELDYKEEVDIEDLTISRRSGVNV